MAEGVCLVVPTFNEKENIGPLVDAVAALGIAELTLQFVDDSSPDGTADAIRDAAARFSWVRLVSRKEKLGIGSAYQQGFREALASLDPDVIVEMDADLQHPPSKIPDLVSAVRGGAGVAVASRYVEGGSVEGWGRWRGLVSKVANAYSRRMLGIPVKDATSGFRAYSSEAARVVAGSSLPAKGFEFQVASLHLLKTKVKIVEVPFTFTRRTVGKSKLGVPDVIRFFFAVMRMAL